MSKYPEPSCLGDLLTQHEKSEPDGPGKVQVQHETAALATGPAGPELRSCRSIEAAKTKAFAEQVLLSPERMRPVVGITTDCHTRRPTIDPGDLARRIGSLANIVVLKTGDAT